MKEVAHQPDIMGALRAEIESFYKRDHVEIVEETEFVEHTFFTDLNFSHNCRVTQVRWHPIIEGIVAMSVVENTIYEEYLSNLTKRMVMPTMLMIWSMAHPLFPQVRIFHFTKKWYFASFSRFFSIRFFCDVPTTLIASNGTHWTPILLWLDVWMAK